MIVLAVLSGLNSLPSELFSYDTAEPWSRFVGMTILALVRSIPFALIVLGLWLVLDAMRRRVGIPMLAGEPSRSASKDMVIAGLGIGGIVYAMTHPLNVFALRGVMPRTPTTVLNQALPALAGIPDLPMSTVMIVALVGIPLLVVAGITQQKMMRALIAVIALALIGVVGWSIDPDADPLGVALVIASLAAVSVAFVAWGTLSAWSWVVAALAYQSLSGLRGAAYGATWQDRAAAAILVLAAGALIALIARRAARGRVQEAFGQIKNPAASAGFFLIRGMGVTRTAAPPSPRSTSARCVRRSARSRRISRSHRRQLHLLRHHLPHR